MHYLALTSIAVLLWSSLAVLVAQLSHIPAFFLLACGLFIGGSLSLVQYKQWQLQPKLLLVGVGGIFGYHFLLFMALRTAPPVAANLLNYLWPLFILLLTPLFFNDIALRKRHILGALISLTGAGLIVVADSATNAAEFSNAHIVGYILAILAALTWACYSLLTKKLTRQYQQFGSATVGLFCLISAGLAAVSHVTFESTPTLSWSDARLLFILGLGPLGVSFYCWDAAVKKGDPRVIATMSYFTPFLSTLLLIIFSEQVFGQRIFLAMSLIVAGALVANVNLALLVKRYQGVFSR